MKIIYNSLTAELPPAIIWPITFIAIFTTCSSDIKTQFLELVLDISGVKPSPALLPVSAPVFDADGPDNSVLHDETGYRNHGPVLWHSKFRR